MDVTPLRVHEPVAAAIAAEYLEAAPVRTSFVEATYGQLATETDRLFAALTAPERPGAVRVAFSFCSTPYDNAEDLIASVRDARLLEVTAAFADHDRKHPVFSNAVGGEFDRFRAVHDILGHGWLRVGFDRHGEYAAWRFQEPFHSALARPALATELHAKHSAFWTTGELPDHNAVLIDPRLVQQAREATGGFHGLDAARS